MLTLAIETSTHACSVAILEDFSPRSEITWEQGNRRNQGFFPVILSLLKKEALPPKQIDFFAVGLGPGSFSSIRIALSAARAMALPGNRPVRGLPSAAAIAWEIMNRDSLPSISVMGDARRDRLWLVQYEAATGGPILKRDFTLITPNEVPALLSQCAAMASPDFDRLTPSLVQSIPGPVVACHQRVAPSAATVGRLLVRAEREGHSPWPLHPIYMHPAATAKPRAPVSGKP